MFCLGERQQLHESYAIPHRQNDQRDPPTLYRKAHRLQYQS